ncbi:MAG: ATP-grasp domain-containing protein [Candidatus Omnitrophica bacterium]|nr:ATP-grasp domain-containing protein [Candidatus Omnitrophota bacterium]
MKKKLKVLMLFYSPYQKPRGYDYREEFADPDNMYTEKDVKEALLALGHEVSLLGVYNDITPLFEEVQVNKPDIIFNMMEMFNDQTQLEKNMAALLEIMGVPYTGSSAGNIFVCNNKALSKKIFNFHHIKVSKFHTYYRGKRKRVLVKLRFPMVIKPLCEEASRGISQASIVDNPQAFMDRIKFIHESMQMDAIAEEYIEGRELYVSVLGDKQMTVLPFREMLFGKMPEGEPRIATYKAKWDEAYRRKWGIKSVEAANLTDDLMVNINDVCQRAYQALDLESYVRFDIRLTPEGEVYIIEANANPCIAKMDEVALSALKAGISYEELIQKILDSGLSRQ